MKNSFPPKSTPTSISRREFLKKLAVLLAGAPFISSLSILDSLNAFAEQSDLSPIRKTIPSTGEKIPVIGMGTWQTFHVSGPTEIDARAQVLKAFFDLGGGMIDSSPMYGLAEQVLGKVLPGLTNTDSLFSASKIWNMDPAMGPRQFEDSCRLWKLPNFDLFQVHNLLTWEEHLATLRELKESGRIRYLGITTSHGRRHRELERIMRTQPLDFIQVTYNIRDREVEDRILPLAADEGIAVIANRPYQGGYLIDDAQRRALPEWAADMGCANWPEFLLKFIVSHPAVTCAIPATRQVEHMNENMRAGYGILPSQAMRKRMAELFT